MDSPESGLLDPKVDSLTLKWTAPQKWTPGQGGIGDYGPFKSVGDALATPASAYCMRNCLESYFRRTRGLNLRGGV